MWRFSRAAAWRIRFRILSGAVSIVLLLSIPRAALLAEGQVRIGYDDYWYYHGEVEPKPAVATSCNGIPCRQICDEALCAHGTGSYGTDGGQSYVGEFRHGWMHGHGEYSSDFVSYVGGFKNGIAVASQDLATQAAVLDMIEKQIGPNIVLWSSHLICKPPRSGMHVPWHQDTPYWNISGPLPGSIWLALVVPKVRGGNRALLSAPRRPRCRAIGASRHTSHPCHPGSSGIT
jgi:hypothetical protein